MKVTHKKRYYVLSDKILSEPSANCYYVENDIVKKQPFASFDNTSNSPFLPENPVGWKDEEIAWMTGDQYMLNRSFNLALEFVYDGARIIRNRQYFGRGYEEEMYLTILKWNREDDIYYEEYKGKLDLSTSIDTINGGIAVNSIEGGILSYLNANKNTTYEIACDESNPAAQLVLLDGMNLSDSLKYEGAQYEQQSEIETLYIDDVSHTYWTIGFVYAGNEGDNEGVSTGNPTAEKIGTNQADIDAYASASANYVLSTENAIAGMDLTGRYDYKTINLATDSIDDEGHHAAVSQSGLEPNIYYFTSSDSTLRPLYTGNNNYAPVDSIGMIPFSDGVNLAPGDKLFICVDIRTNTPAFPWVLTEFNIVEEQTTSFFKTTMITSKVNSTAFCLYLYEYFKQLVLKLTDGKYTGESTYLQSRTDLVVTCGDALRNTDRTVVKNYLIASSFDDFFKSVPGDKNVGSSVGLQIRGNVLYLELLSDLYNDSTQIYDLGEVSKLRFKVAQNEICNTIENGYPDQEYDTNGGKYEVNSEQDWQLPVLSNQQVFDIRSVWRADPRGIEQIRSKYTKLDTTDNKGDKEPFLIMVSAEAITQSYTASRVNDKEYTGASWIDYDFTSASFGATMALDANGYIVRFTGTFNRADLAFYITIDNDSHTCQVLLFKNGQSIATTVTTNTDGTSPITFFIPNIDMQLNDNFEVRVIPFDAGFETFTVIGATLYFEFLIKPLTLLRLNYDQISGVVDNSVFNVELRPRNQILWHGNELRGKLIQLQSQNITLNTAAKNRELSTTINGITEKESDPIKVSSLADPLYYPYDAVFTTVVPYTFTDLLAMSTAGYFSWTYEGYRFYGLPWGSLKSKPATMESQEWQLRLSPKNLFSDLFGVSYNEIINLSTNNTNMIAVSIYAPLHWIKYNYSPQSKYHHIDMHEDWSYRRFQNWVTKPFYTQKWQLTDTIKTPVLTKGLGALSMFVYDKNGELYTTSLFSVITTPYVQLPFVLQECDLPLNTFDPGLYLFVIMASDVPVWISEWCELKANWNHTFLINYSHSNNEKNLPWKAYNGFMELRVEAEFGQWEPEAETIDYEDDTANFTVLNGQPLQKRALLIGHTIKVPEWMGLKVNSILLKDRVFIDGTTSDESKHYTRRQSSQMELVRYSGMPWMSYSIEVIPANNPLMLTEEDLPINDVNGWHATIDAQVFGSDTGSTEITILNQ